MKYLVDSTNTKDVSPYVAEEIRRVSELQAAGILTNIWMKSDQSGAVLVLECADRDEATSILNTFPIVINDAATLVVTELADLDSVEGVTR